MTPEQQKRVDELFDKLIQLPATHRDEELERQCGHDGGIRDKSRRLSHRRVGDEHRHDRFAGVDFAGNLHPRGLPSRSTSGHHDRAVPRSGAGLAKVGSEAFTKSNSVTPFAGWWRV